MKLKIVCLKIKFDFKIRMDGNLSVNEAYQIAHHIHDMIEYKFENVKHCMVHVNLNKR